MSFTDAFRVLNSFKRRRVIRDYAVIGAVAATAYMEPMFTEDLDIIILVDSDEEYLQTFRRISELSEGQEGMHQTLDGVPVQMFRTTTMRLYRDALDAAHTGRVGGLRVKMVTAEHLILLYLGAFRDKDQMRIRLIMPVADMDRLHILLNRFDEKNRLAGRLQSLLGTSIPRESEVAPSPRTNELDP